MAQADAPGVRTGKPLIERDRAEGTTVHDPNGNRIGTIKRLVTERFSSRIAHAAMSRGGRGPRR